MWERRAGRTGHPAEAQLHGPCARHRQGSSCLRHQHHPLLLPQQGKKKKEINLISNETVSVTCVNLGSPLPLPAPCPSASPAPPRRLRPLT